MSEPNVSAGAPAKPQDENQSVMKSAGMIGVATFSSRVLGFIRDMVLAEGEERGQATFLAICGGARADVAWRRGPVLPEGD